MVWGGGGGGVCAAVGNAAAVIAAGYAKYVVVYRSLAQGQFYRFGQGGRSNNTSGIMAYSAPYGLMSPGQTVILLRRKSFPRFSAMAASAGEAKVSLRNRS